MTDLQDSAFPGSPLIEDNSLSGVHWTWLLNGSVAITMEDRRRLKKNIWLATVISGAFSYLGEGCVHNTPTSIQNN